MKTPVPTLDYERDLLGQGVRLIAGVDEAGRGSIFGPVCVGMVVLPLVDLDAIAAHLSEVRDSKKLHRPKVYRLAPIIQDLALAWGVGQAAAAEVDQHGIVGGIRLAAERALVFVETQLSAKVEYLLTDSTMPTPTGFDPTLQRSLVKGDQDCLSIACAAILAKKCHDDVVRELAADLSEEYQLTNNVGYGTPGHISAIKRLGVTPHHRRSFRPIAQRPLPGLG